jgi:tetratricopeptide (TPR) repeat protein
MGMWFTSNLLADDTQSFTLDLGAAPKTLGDIKPAFLSFKQESLPNIPIKEVIRRYRKLFDTTSDPVVRIDALHRMTSLESRFGDKRELSQDQQRALYKKALQSYELIVGSGVYYRKVDELLYQTAKAYDLTGQYAASIRSLTQLVGLYPHSKLATESLFRIGEANFSLGKYQQAEKAYQRTIDEGKDNPFYDKALFMLGWSQFKQAHYDQSSVTFTKVLDRALVNAGSSSLKDVKKSDIDTVADTIRVLSITFSYQKGAEGLATLISQVGVKPYTFNLYNALAKLYIKQQRYEDSASTSREFIKKYPDNPEVPLMAVAIIDAYKKGHFAVNVWDEKENYIKEFGLHGPRWSRMPTSTQQDVKPYLVKFLNELSHLNYVNAERATKSEEKRKDYQKAAKYFIEAVRTDPNAETKGESLFLAGESYFQINDYPKAIAAYKESAYDSKPHLHSAEAGYAVITTYNIMENKVGSLTQESKRDRQSSMLKFADAFPNDNRVPSVLNQVANWDLQSGNYKEAILLSERVLSNKGSHSELRLSSWLVNGHAHFQIGDYDLAEKAYQSALGFKSLAKAKRRTLRERLAATIYREAEKLDQQGKTEQAIQNYLRVGQVIPESRVRINAHFDAATRLLAIKQWQRAISVLKDFQRLYPDSPLAVKIPEKIIYAELQDGHKEKAAGLLVDLAKSTKDVSKAKDALYQAADLYAQAGNAKQSTTLLKRYVRSYPLPVGLNIEAQMRIANYYATVGEQSKRNYWLRKIIVSDSKAGKARNDRSRFLAVSAATELANQDFDAFNRIKLKLPLKKHLELKKKALKRAVSAFERVARYGNIQFTTEATYKLGAIYQRLSQDLINSERPKHLSSLQAEQYTILLEEQAYPFEEKAINLYKMNIKRVKNDVFDKWVKESYKQLGKIVPASYKRTERRFEHAVPIN